MASYKNVKWRSDNDMDQFYEDLKQLCSEYHAQITSYNCLVGSLAVFSIKFDEEDDDGKL